MPILLAVYTGARQGEICGLCWSDIDLNSGKISIYHSLQRQEGELVLKEPKSKGSRRSIPIPIEVITELKRIKVQQAERKLAMGMGYDQCGFVCAWEDGRPFDPDWVSKQWRRLVQTDIKKTDEQKVDRNIPEGIRFHDLRHTHATLLLSQGVSIKVVQERLGHESITTTGDIYSHVTPAMQEHAVKILDSMFDISR
jgi:integrase